MALSGLRSLWDAKVANLITGNRFNSAEWNLSGGQLVILVATMRKLLLEYRGLAIQPHRLKNEPISPRGVSLPDYTNRDRSYHAKQMSNTIWTNSNRQPKSAKPLPGTVRFRVPHDEAVDIGAGNGLPLAVAAWHLAHGLLFWLRFAAVTNTATPRSRQASWHDGKITAGLTCTFRHEHAACRLFEGVLSTNYALKPSSA